MALSNLIYYNEGTVQRNKLFFRLCSNENGAVLLRIRLLSRLQRRKCSPKAESFENALQSGAIWKRCFLKKLFYGVDGEDERWPAPLYNLYFDSFLLICTSFVVRTRGIVCVVYLLSRLANYNDPCKRCVVAEDDAI